jgi:hypothetical protein
VLYHFTYVDPVDFGPHLEFARRMWLTGALNQPHFLFHLVAGALQWLLSRSGLTAAQDYRLAGLLTAVACCCASALLLYNLVRRARQEARPGDAYRDAALSLSLMLVVPLPIFALLDRHFYLGYLGINVYHNPTILIAKPFAIALFALAASALGGFGGSVRRRTAGEVIGIAALTVLAVLAKPSYVLCLVPAIVIMAAWQRRRNRPVDAAALFGGIVLPALATLAWQYRFAFDRPGPRNSVILAPLQALAMQAGHFGTALLLPKLLVALSFPLLIWFSYHSEARRDAALTLAWITFGFGAACAYLLGESARMADMNFTWSGQIALFILFVASTLFLLRQRAPSNGDGTSLPAPAYRRAIMLYRLHVLCGILYAVGIVALGKWK